MENENSLEEFIKDLGFASLKEWNNLVAKADLSTPERLKAFEDWKENDGSKDGLLKLYNPSKPKSTLDLKMQQELFIEYKDYSQENVLLGLSGGINSMAVLVWLASWPENLKPKELHLVYHHFEEHSPDTLPFVMAGVKYATEHFNTVIYHQSNNSVLEFFEKAKMIPHPSISPCTRLLKIAPMFEYMALNNITVNVVGYVKEELRRVKNMAKKTGSKISDVKDSGVSIQFPISNYSDDWCFQIVKNAIGWYPAIYDLKDDSGKPVFKHNNCLPCKNMNVKDLQKVKTHFPDYFERAHKLTDTLNRQWGRDADQYYTTFGRPDYEDNAPCETCNF